jgi:hypothetical protein
MTKCKAKIRPTWHETNTVIDGRALCIAERPSCLLMRLKGTRTTLMLPWSTAHLRAAVLRADQQAMVKRRRRTPVARGRL